MFTTNKTDFDPLVDVEVTVEIQTIRFLEGDALQTSARSATGGILQFLIERIIGKKIYEETNENTNPSLYLKVFINDVEFESTIWSNTNYIYDPQWSATLNVPDDQEFVDIKIQLWNSKNGGDALCDISGDSGSSDDSYDAELEYSIKTGHWTGDDELPDPSGYGRLCGCDDGTIYEKNRDSELWFNIYQNDYDGDGIPYWTEINEYESDPEVKDSGDPDNDGIPVEWEWKWDYDPFEAENHGKLDPDRDSIDNVEEYLTSEWFSDPFRKDVFVELDIMEEGPNGEKTYFPVNSKELIQTAFDRQNIVFHLDYGTMGGHDVIPFDDIVRHGELNTIYWNYFLEGNEGNWRRGVFHYGVVVYKSDGPAGYVFRRNAFQVASSGHEKLLDSDPKFDRDIVYGSAYMHELGHTFGFWPIPGHAHVSGIMGILYHLYNMPYTSCMNYFWMYKFVDYSDGSRGDPDLNDWDPNRMRFSYFEGQW